ncbi:MAG: cytochrome c3 family protein [Nitrospirae bacterium]|nr:cytochrome c3 family protein [Nitrospirota bacterium]
MTLNPLTLLIKILRWYAEEISPKARILYAIGTITVLGVMAIVGYKVNEFGEQNPKACLMCHVHDAAQEAWSKSKHAKVNCHDCHHASKAQQITQMIKFAFMGQKSVPARHGEVIVPWKLCMNCHWERDPRYPEAMAVNRSPYHAKHVFIEKIECSKCHGYRVHQFPPEERFCLSCHKDKEVHGVGMESLACLNCHTDRTKDLRPGRNKCLYCHGSDKVRKELDNDPTIDVKYFKPKPEVIKKADKINIPANAPMQFPCYTCHKPHGKVKLDWGECLTKCHNDQLNVGKHMIHVKGMNMKCIDCHKQHAWRVSPEQAKKDCAKCHEYKDPMKFIGG